MAIFKVIDFAVADDIKLLERLNYIREPYATITPSIKETKVKQQKKIP